MENAGEEGRRGWDRDERGGAMRGSLPLRCPVVTAQPDGPALCMGAAIGEESAKCTPRRVNSDAETRRRRALKRGIALRLCASAPRRLNLSVHVPWCGDCRSAWRGVGESD